MNPPYLRYVVRGERLRTLDAAKRFLALSLAFSALIVPACSGSDEGGEDCAALFELLDEFRAAHQEKVIASEAETDAELEAYKEERDRLILQYEDAGCGTISGEG